MHRSRNIKRLTAAAGMAAAIFGGVSIAASSADLHTQIQASKSAAASLQSEINSETAQIRKTQDGVAAAEQRYATVETDLEQHIAQLRVVADKVMAAGQQLDALEKKLRIANTYLAANLRAQYESGTPNLVDVILNSHGFSNLVDQINYIKDAQHRDAQVVDVTEIMRARVQKEAISLGKLELRDRDLTNQILQQRNQAAAIKAALVEQEIYQETRRSHTKARLASADARIAELQKKYEAEVAAAEARARQSAAQQAEQVNQQASGYAINSSGVAQPPPGAPAAVQAMFAAGDRIATLPYIWGGGHGSFVSAGYDCSGSVSYVLNAAGLLSSPEVSGAFESYGDPGPGQWVTIYANAGHVWMQIAGWRFDTVALAEYGSRWSQGGGEFAGFVVRHPVGL